jgi:hypothetical protein
MSPSKFRGLPWEDKAEMIAHDRDFDLMQQYEQYLANQRLKRLSRHRKDRNR